MIPVSCIVIHNGKEYMFNSIADYVVRDISKEPPATLEVGEVQSSPVSQMMAAAAGIMANYNDIIKFSTPRTIILKQKKSLNFNSLHI